MQDETVQVNQKFTIGHLKPHQVECHSDKLGKLSAHVIWLLVPVGDAATGWHAGMVGEEAGQAGLCVQNELCWLGATQTLAPSQESAFGPLLTRKLPRNFSSSRRAGKRTSSLTTPRPHSFTV